MKDQQYSILLVALVIIHGSKGISNTLTLDPQVRVKVNVMIINQDHFVNHYNGTPSRTCASGF